MASTARSSISKRARLALALLLALPVSGCLSVRRELALEQTRQHVAWAALATPPRRETRTFSWAGALAQLRAANPKIRSAELDLIRAREAREQVRRSLIPLVSLQSGYNRSFGGSSLNTFDPFYFAATVFFDVPGFMNYRTRAEAAELTLTRAELGREAVWREQVTSLYRAAAAQEDLAAQLARLQRQQARARALAPGAPRAATAAQRRLLPAQTRLDAQLADAREKVADLLGLPGTPIVFSGPLPDPGYDRVAQRPAPAQLAGLPLRLAAIELVALRARQLGVRLQAWPEVNFSVSTPTLYRRTNGQSDYWSSHDTLAGANAFWTLDTRGRQASEGRILTAELALRRTILEQEAHRVAAQLHTALDQLQVTDREFAALNAALPDAPERLRPDLLARRDALAAERREWEVVLWFFDDTRWTTPAPPTTVALAASSR
ncbi:TolC family protein [Horticoccus luteus]|uniref:TolC family protein n=1 Tax=Horticoccus luteus TaxID=2862869 RepID=A0A8F9TVP0_9BACT|nr:TolC family protein [Horticoccus luteus]QYM78927.1 TolC family protein [Horticoccus luteus]